MAEDDFEETRVELLELTADAELGKVRADSLYKVEMRLVFLNWCVEHMRKYPSANDRDVLLMTIEYFRLQERMFVLSGVRGLN